MLGLLPARLQPTREKWRAVEKCCVERVVCAARALARPVMTDSGLVGLINLRKVRTPIWCTDLADDEEMCAHAFVQEKGSNDVHRCQWIKTTR